MITAIPSLAHKGRWNSAFVRVVWHWDDIYLYLVETTGGERLDFGSLQRPQGKR